MRPRGRNPYTLRVPNGPTTPITEPANVLVPPVAPAAGTQQPPPRVDGVQTLASSSSFATASTSSSYVDDVRYFRYCSYETQASVASSRAPRTEIQPNTPSMFGRLYCSSCKRHRRRRDFQRTSSNCTSCSSQYSAYTGYSAIADRNPSLETTDTNNRGPQRPSKDNSDSHSVSSHRSHRSRRSHWSVLSTFSRKKSQTDRMTTEQQQASGLAIQDNVKMSNPNIKKDNRGKIHLIVFCLSYIHPSVWLSEIKFSHFNLLPNHWPNFNQTWYDLYLLMIGYVPLQGENIAT